ncbi:hypothetical protein [Comamonas aquatica]|uniref:hypothetical protein n=1 Tax=Comamonas aquatica TaxID=225991 RepID=UPI0012EAF358|nr:hypothetical protein [Comamonas aquatica]
MLTRTGCWLTLGWLAFSVQAAQPVPAADAAPSPQELQQRAQQRAQERQDILHTRSQIDARRVEGEKACWQRFAVDNCLREVRAQAREQDTALRERELRINSEERQEKASERLRAIEQKQREKHAPAPMTSSTKQGAQPAVKTPAELARTPPGWPSARPSPRPSGPSACRRCRTSKRRPRRAAPVTQNRAAANPCPPPRACRSPKKRSCWRKLIQRFKWFYR